MRSPASVAGAALALVLLLITALSALGFGALSLARRQAVAARVGEAVLQASLAAESGIRSLDNGWPREADTLSVGASVWVTGSVGETGTYGVRLRRLGPELYLAEATGRHVGGRAWARASAAFWRLDPVTRVAAAPAVVVHGGGLSLAGSGQVTFSSKPWSSRDDLCAQWIAALDTLFPGAGPPAAAPLPGVSVTAWGPGDDLLPFEPRPDTVAGPGLGLIPLDSLLAVAAPLGDSFLPPDKPCSGAANDTEDCPVPGIYRIDAGSVVSGGSVRGVLVADGDVTLRGDALVEGWFLTSGNLSLGQSARIRGFVRAAGRVSVTEAARIEGEPCLAASTLDGSWLGRGRALPPGSGLGPRG